MKLYDHYPSKRYGQNFLKNKQTAIKFVNLPLAHFPDPPPAVLEIGPGMGSLTFELAEKFPAVTAIEKDEKIIQLWQNEIKSPSNVEIVAGDGWSLDYSYYHKKLGRRLWIYGNLPFNVATEILTNIFSQSEAIEVAVLCFQKEVAQRIIAKTGDKNYGSLSLLTHLYADVVSHMSIAKSQYHPVPKVDSKVLCFRCLKGARTSKRHAIEFEKFFKNLFLYRRKTLVNGILRHGKFSQQGDLAKMWLSDHGKSVTTRAEELSFDEHYSLFTFISEEAHVQSI